MVVKQERSLISGFLRSLHNAPASPCLEIGDTSLTYGVMELRREDYDLP